MGRGGRIISISVARKESSATCRLGSQYNLANGELKRRRHQNSLYPNSPNVTRKAQVASLQKAGNRNLMPGTNALLAARTLLWDTFQSQYWWASRGERTGTDSHMSKRKVGDFSMVSAAGTLISVEAAKAKWAIT